MSQKCYLYAHCVGPTGPALGDVILDGVSGGKVSILYLGFLNGSILVVAMISSRFWLYMGPVVATFYLTNFLATDRYCVKLAEEGAFFAPVSEREFFARRDQLFLSAPVWIRSNQFDQIRVSGSAPI